MFSPTAASWFPAVGGAVWSIQWFYPLSVAHLAVRSAPSPSPLVRVRRQRSHDRPPVLPGEIQAVLDGCAVYDVTAGRRVGNLRDRLLFAVQIDWTVAEALQGWSYATR